MVANTGKRLIKAMKGWHTWSAKVGPLENMAKQVVVVKNTIGMTERKRFKEELAEAGWTESEKPAAEVLGTMIGNVGRKLEKKEQKRIDEFFVRTTWIGKIADNLMTEWMLKRSICMSVYTYGWITRMPGKLAMDKAARAMMGRQMKGESFALKCILEGECHTPYV